MRTNSFLVDDALVDVGTIAPYNEECCDALEETCTDLIEDDFDLRELYVLSLGQADLSEGRGLS